MSDEKLKDEFLVDMINRGTFTPERLLSLPQIPLGTFPITTENANVIPHR